MTWPLTSASHFLTGTGPSPASLAGPAAAASTGAARAYYKR
jgi:hypothetical protein